MEGEVKELKARLSQSELDCSRLQGALTESQSALSLARSDCEEAKAVTASVQRELGSLRVEVEDLQRENDELVKRAQKAELVEQQYLHPPLDTEQLAKSLRIAQGTPSSAISEVLSPRSSPPTPLLRSTTLLPTRRSPQPASPALSPSPVYMLEDGDTLGVLFAGLESPSGSAHSLSAQSLSSIDIPTLSHTARLLGE
eukprot:gnl/Dysnectes_brevis/9918_a18931_131.p1 GENE.gnl/Dysnectes_brevis/9918_a18931_131~~gnl/Dysnectes_brevis/9918_a18931_131.p1  ORF type:complete len:198 (+),score=75.64 gnl/Dysnectes_brevis/9918_a18931_131:254-847(+)